MIVHLVYGALCVDVYGDVVKITACSDAWCDSRKLP